MPEYLIRDNDSMPKFAKIDPSGKKIIWAIQSEATGFPTPEAASSAFESACLFMLNAAQARLKKAQDAGGVVPGPHGSAFILKRDLGTNNSFPYELARSTPIELFALQWLCRKTEDHEVFHVASRPTQDDLLGAFETFYVRSQEGWLSRPHTKNSSEGLEWDDSFGMAVPFSSREAAQAELACLKMQGHIIKTSCVFTQAEPVGSPPPDPVSDGIKSACEARDIESFINESARGRFEAMRQAEDSVKPKRAAPRL